MMLILMQRSKAPPHEALFLKSQAASSGPSSCDTRKIFIHDCTRRQCCLGCVLRSIQTQSFIKQVFNHAKSFVFLLRLKNCNKSYVLPLRSVILVFHSLFTKFFSFSSTKCVQSSDIPNFRAQPRHCSYIKQPFCTISTRYSFPDI